MRLSSFFAASLACLAASPVNAQYFSEGWKPGQPVPQATPQAHPGGVPPFERNNPPRSPPPTPPSQRPPFTLKSLTSLFDLTNILQAEPIANLFEKAGINITEKVLSAQQSVTPWDQRVPLITDDNYEEIIVNEQFESEEEEKDRVWFLIITVTAGQPGEGLSKLADNHFDQAYNVTQLEGDLPNVRWGRIDYLNVTAITTKWAVWHAPTIVVATNRGQTLRFYKARQLRLTPENIREFLHVEGWKQTPPWESSFGPGGSNEYILTYLSILFTKFYNITVLIPKWMLVLVTGMIGSFIINLFHRNPTKPVAKTVVAEKEVMVVGTEPSTPTPSTPGKKAGGKKKGGKR
ncbi:hypothetical protein JAAARDRAFT_74964 [Jaapia argillacea MUCL 33604]|uniref:Thioredoxin domain-containing protein n=1 Tax=Jaapia argillacea MUCL 33604 TaxID=933084 RepID=A0A067QB63_9AGAM|nr:hypothetical protein JAAARDRAFT_74964 [Jaapia argillacea MUCL 33604]